MIQEGTRFEQLYPLLDNKILPYTIHTDELHERKKSRRDKASKLYFQEGKMFQDYIRLEDLMLKDNDTQMDRVDTKRIRELQHSVLRHKTDKHSIMMRHSYCSLFQLDKEPEPFHFQNKNVPVDIEYRHRHKRQNRILLHIRVHTSKKKKKKAQFLVS